MKKILSFIFIVLIALSITACANNNSPTAYMAVFTNGVMYLGWTNSDGHLTGTLQETYQDGSSFEVKSESNPFTGSISGSDISITVSLWGFPIQTYTGTSNDNQLVLSFPQQNGTLQTVTFHSGTAGDYNKAVQSLETSLQNGQATATEQQIVTSNEQATTTAINAAQQATTTAINTEQSQLSTALNNLQRDSDFSQSFANYDQHITNAQNDLHTEQQETDCGLKQGDAGLVKGDSELIQTDDTFFNNQVSSANNDIQTIQQVSQSLNQTAPDISSETSAIRNAKVKAVQYDATIQQIVQQANTIAKC